MESEEEGEDEEEEDEDLVNDYFLFCVEGQHIDLCPELCLQKDVENFEGYIAKK